MKLNSWFTATLFAAALVPEILRSQEAEKPVDATTPPNSDSETKSEEKKKEGDWVEFYYQDPDPSQLVSKVKEWAADGSLEQERIVPVIIGFLSQVFRQNRDQIKSWDEQLSGLSEKQKMVIHTAMAFSRTTEADAIMEGRLGKAYQEQKDKFPKITEMSLAQPAALDTLMGYFYATGSEKAVRRIIWSFRFDGAPENPNFADVPEGYRPFYKQLPDEAAWRLKSLLHHPKALEICEGIYENDESLLASERKGLGELLGKEKSTEKSKKENPEKETP